MQFINDELIKRNKNLLDMGEAVLEESISRAITNFGAKHYDDACLVVWQFTPTKQPATTANQPATSSSSPSLTSSNGNAHGASSGAVNGQAEQQDAHMTH